MKPSVDGVAGSSHFFGVLPALALPTQGAALVYIGAFEASRSHFASLGVSHRIDVEAAAVAGRVLLALAVDP